MNEFIFYSSVAPLKSMIQIFFPMIKEHCLHLIFDAVWNFMEKIVWMNSVLKWYLRFNIKCFNPWANHNLTRVRRLARPQDTIRQRHQPIIWKYLWSGGRLLLDAELPSDIKFSFTRWFIKATTHRWIKMFTRRGYKTCELVPFCYWLQMLCC